MLRFPPHLIHIPRASAAVQSVEQHQTASVEAWTADGKADHGVQVDDSFLQVRDPHRHVELLGLVQFDRFLEPVAIRRRYGLAHFATSLSTCASTNSFAGRRNSAPLGWCRT